MDINQSLIFNLIFFAGIAQIALVFGSLAIPAMLNWKTELVKVSLLIKQMFWTYAAYILVINLCFGVLSVFAIRELLNGSLLALLICGFIAVYWISRVLIQFLYFDRKSFPKGKIYMAGEFMLVVLFVFLSIVYSWAFYINWVS
ncbi:hypothetical protein SAMN04487898_10438 [Pedobacter sp. ok626]|uniref:hypothetical protein n=1 Tax=Pedobacter sp. ok626 TaxID=1761882 RepID=UPI00088AB697|nr:hypothetical protein [Pedobacter sp. ok626]SDJ70261.1 hypothetical protein SAMN04487898_10438 [Pedobacter sp. ok626]